MYSIESNIYADISETIDVPEAKPILLRYFDLLPEEEDHDIELGIELIKLFKSKSHVIYEILKSTDIGYSTLILVSRSITPEFWTRQNVRLIKNRHQQILAEIFE